MSVSTLLSGFALLSLILHRAVAQSGIICVDPVPLILENESPLTLTFTRKQGTSGTITATYTISSLSATTADYGGSPTGTITMNDGETTASLDIPITDDSLMEPTEQFRFILSGANVGPDSNVLISIQDDDVYSPWSQWVDGTCTTTCDPGTKTDTRDRTCVSPFTNLCVQPLTDTRTNPCNLGDCTVITEWTTWADDGSCSATCGPGIQSQVRNRTCSGICPGNFMGMEARNIDCNEGPCPVITEWTAWADDGSCSVTCGLGIQSQVRNRTCSANCPANFMGTETRTVDCNNGPCPVITEWTAWADDGSCSVTCGPGIQSQVRNRTCSANCPANFMGMETRTVDCNNGPCPVITEWTAWADDGSCSVTCGLGIQSQVRNRTCSANCPANFMGTETRTVDCNNGLCPKTSQWCSWTTYGGCSVHCGNGVKTQVRSRYCYANCPANFVKYEMRKVNCTMAPCSTSGWSKYNRWTGRGWHGRFGRHHSSWTRWTGSGSSPSSGSGWSGWSSWSNGGLCMSNCRQIYLRRRSCPRGHCSGGSLQRFYKRCFTNSHCRRYRYYG
ncbi:A disintegrin and metalloproteinase with thrombospondin motifs adt-2-like isoform X1 [Haliotis rufescens]|uniref:A disintegrin and metalloproteinase with thrombospondin motifs adt-2-like isoform X1 n=1 Tax=Haliotis rufescens TaxID=6454 RepID=UPI00201FAADB|nr:A disintegrin and metalloproteinase with thrombospondin motifs adt-2-like isoform X1 [Haliotis rufescens]